MLKAAAVLPGAKYAVFYCADNLEGEPAKGGEQAPGQYYESLALVDAILEDGTTRLVSANIHATSDSTGSTRWITASPKVDHWPASTASTV